ncbi:MAG: MFS transporter, partial [Lachnospiraceae bacterium]|nr:MFS transporter [Lachnospiraceae bacterium]
MMIGDGCSALGVIYILIAMIRGNASLLEICIGVSISAVFSALLQPAYMATITDLLDKDEFSKANGLVSVAGNARYLFSPLIAGLLLAVSNIKLLLVIDICTFFLTVISCAVVRKGTPTNAVDKKEPFIKSLKEGWNVIVTTEGILAVVIIAAFISLMLSVFQVLAEPFILSFADAKTLGVAETVCAVGMLASAIVLGVKGIKSGFVNKLAVSFIFAGIAIFGFGMFNNIVVACACGFLFFAMLPIANNSLDYLVRTNIPDEVQGRAWGVIGFISNLGCVIAYASSGVLADTIGNVTGLGVGRGSALVMQVAGICLIIIAVSIFGMKSIKKLETEPIVTESVNPVQDIA